MVTHERYLQFENIDMEQPDISSRCSHCGQEFRAEPKPAERVDDVRCGYALILRRTSAACDLPMLITASRD